MQCSTISRWSALLPIRLQAADTRQDEDPKGGQFKVSDLTNGTYTLKEINAPNGFDASKAKTYTIVIKNGQVTSSDLPEKVENPRLTGKRPGRRPTIRVN